MLAHLVRSPASVLLSVQVETRQDPVWFRLAARSIRSFKAIELYFHGDVGLWRRCHVNPVEMIRAQLAIAERNEVHLVREDVTRIGELSEGRRKIHTSTGRSFEASKVLLCTEAYTNFLMPEKLRLSVKTKAVSVLLAEVDDEEVSRLAGMPSGEEYQERLILTEHEFLEWFRGPGSETETHELLGVVVKLLPGLKLRSLITMVSYSRHGYPYVDRSTKSRCGAAGKSGDEIGKMASLLVYNGEWSYPELDAFLFAF